MLIPKCKLFKTN